MNDISSDGMKDLKSHMTTAGETVGGRVQTAAVIAAAVADQARTIGEDTATSIAAAAGQAEQVLRDASKTAQEAWSQAGEVTGEFVDKGRRATQSISRLIQENPLI